MTGVAARLASSGRERLWHWHPDHRKTFYLCAIIFGISAALFLFYLQKAVGEYNHQRPGHPANFGDFFALWSYAKIAFRYPASELYDLVALHRRQVELGMDPNGQNPFPYPPTFIFLLWPLNFVSYSAAYFIWTATTYALFVWSVAATCSRLPLCILGTAVAPVVTANIAAGQSGFVSAALISAGIRLAGTRPVMSGIFFGVLSYKPQLGILVPVALIAGGFWTALAASLITMLVLAAAATIAFGWTIWQTWTSMLPVYSKMFDGATANLKLMPTVTGCLRMVGFTPLTAAVMQTICAVIVAVSVGFCFRQGATKTAAAALLVGTFLATPHALIYDMPMIVAAMALYIDARWETVRAITLVDVSALALVMLYPVLMMTTGFHAPFNIVPLIALFSLILWHEKKNGGGNTGSDQLPPKPVELQASEADALVVE